jgi:hypothetical protein
LIRVGKREAPLPCQRATSTTPPTEAAPKCISGRTSYLRVRLAFHPYPQVIPTVCNPYEFGPPRACSARFTLPMGSSPGFGSTRRDSSPFRTRFRSGSACPWLNLATPNHSLAHSTKGTPSLPKKLRPAGSRRFQDLFHSPRRGAFHRSLTVLVHYRSPAVFSLGSWSTRFPTRFFVPGGTHERTALAASSRRLRGSHPLRPAVPGPFGCNVRTSEGSVAPSQLAVLPQRSSADWLVRPVGLGSSRFARRYSGNPLFSSRY